MSLDDNQDKDIGNVCIANENVNKYTSYDPDDYVVDDSDEWYNSKYDGE